ncbi:MAG TPA: YcxB family protein [Candidatus Limnocylindrales bacterium]
MHISMWVAYDEKRLRRTLSFILRPQLRRIRIMGGIIIFFGIVLLALDPSQVSGYAFSGIGLLLVAAIGPITVARAVRMQSDVVKEGLHMTLDDEAVTVTYPLVESRFKWAGLGRVVETSEVWYIMFGKIQAITIPKGTMTEEQRAEFATFVATLHPVYV